ncbi:uncharacterized protein LOC115625160 [Scaptodrosophila lebanonensis]|uniref:Uncharacterized protein LOC115625160 n=1 Tax=Drosophila lebanonensis TaxID=7225 RepID=A0A6J2TIV8_DROLE|nr:uncharacterized protein LOC115625160 [Scaptodrosophila lebanonensis]
MSRVNQEEMQTKAAAPSHTQSSSRASAAGAVPGRVGGRQMMALLVAAILLCGGWIGVADGLKCHMCGQYNEGVGSITPCLNYTKDIAHLYLKECTKKSEKFCVKYVSELSTVRDCATECVEKEIWETQTYCCNEDGCNAGSNIGYSTILLVVPLFYMVWSTCGGLLNVQR